jgi:NADH-quinone oxidoreductase subunit F
MAVPLSLRSARPAHRVPSVVEPTPGQDGMDGSEILRRVTASGLRGRGGGWFPTGRKWHAVVVEGGEPMVVANGAEGEPGSIKDRFVMLTRPSDVVAGLVLAARAVGAKEAVVFLKGSFDAPASALAAALRDAPPAGLSVSIRHGDDSYVAGEETAILESLEGKRPWPRPKPPFPAAVGFEGRPTLVQNVETLARVPAAVADPEGFRRTERTFVSVWGHVRRPGVYEVPLGTPLGHILENEAGGAPDGVGLLFPGGPSTFPLSQDRLDTALDPDALKASGSALGTAAILVVGASVSRREVLVSLARFFERESCQQCPPCTMGTASLARIAQAEADGTARARDFADARDVAGFMAGHGYCAHCRTGAAVVGGLLPLAAGEGSRVEPGVFDPFAPDSPERAAIEAVLGAFTPAGARS